MKTTSTSLKAFLAQLATDAALQQLAVQAAVVLTMAFGLVYVAGLFQ